MHEADSAPEPLVGMMSDKEASGTSWQPADAPMRAAHVMFGRWMLMVHGQLDAGYLSMAGPRGSDTFVSTNWAMFMLSHWLLGGRLQFRAMLSGEPITVPARGYPLLLQTGESYRGEALHDVQHPHNLFMELAASYEHELGDIVAFQLYVAPVGEPALGPTAYMHRESAEADPLAPINHHHLDSTHVSFGVVTAGFFIRQLKVEGSVFNGREPDERRFNIEFAPLDSWSVRASYNPLPQLSAQISYGHLKSPELLMPSVNQDRFTASISADVRIGERGTWATTLAYGRTANTNETPTHGVLLETDADVDGDNTVFGRLEWVQRTSDDLALPASFGDQRFGVAQATIGFVHELDRLDGVRPGLGVLGMLSFVPDQLEPLYGGNAMPGGMVFFRLRIDP
jgi:hypothetical protein